jgi:Protein of unknown function (DUF3515)
VTVQGIVNDDTGSGGTAHDPTGSTPPVQPAGRRLSPPLIAALVLGVALVVGVAVAGIVLGPSGGTASTAASTPPSTADPTAPVLLVPVDAPQAGSADCAALLRALPATLTNGRTPLAARELAKPAPQAAVAWGRGDEPAVLRCGIERPPELTPTSELLDVDGVQWLRVSADGLTTWYAVDRPVVVALTLPGDVGTGPIQDVSDSIGATLPMKQVF